MCDEVGRFRHGFRRWCESLVLHSRRDTHWLSRSLSFRSLYRIPVTSGVQLPHLVRCRVPRLAPTLVKVGHHAEVPTVCGTRDHVRVLKAC